MTNIQTWLAEHSNQVNQFNQPISTSDLRRLVGFLLQQNNAWLFSHSDTELNEEQINQLNHWYKLLTQGYPLAYITGTQMFWDMELIVNENTLIPRPDTETLIEVCIELFPEAPESILDLGTGSGAIALALAKIFSHSRVVALDQSESAIEIATKNAQNNQITNISLLVSDWFAAVNDQTFDLIVSNPPYLAADDEHMAALKFEPEYALVAADEGLSDFKAIASKAILHLNAKGILIFEHGWQQKEAVQDILQAAGFKGIKTIKDLAGHDRVSYGHKV